MDRTTNTVTFRAAANKHRCSFQKGELPIPSDFHVSNSVSVPCFNMNGSERALKMLKSDVYLNKYSVIFEQQHLKKIEAISPNCDKSKVSWYGLQIFCIITQRVELHLHITGAV